MYVCKLIKNTAFFIISVCLIARAYAGDIADFKVIGFSPEGDYFAFEQYGIYDGSGFPYSDIFIIETASDSWVSGSPIRTAAKDESTLLSAIRDISANRAMPLLSEFNISQPPHQIISPSEQLIPETINQFIFKIAKEDSPNANKMHEYSVNLKQWEIKNTRCQRYGIDPKLLHLSVKSQLDNKIISQDSALPRSRGCPINYSLHNIYISSQNKEKSVAIAVIVNVYLQGFEGSNRRFLAITSRLD